MSGPGPGETHRACITITGPKTRQQIKDCMAEIKAILVRCGGDLTQENLRDPVEMDKQTSSGKK